MPFSKLALLKKDKDCVSLQVHKSDKLAIKNKIKGNIFRKKVFLFAFFNYKSDGSVTIEAVLSTTAFIMTIVFVMSFMLMVNTEMAIQIHMNNIAQRAAKAGFYIQAANEASDKNESLAKLKKKIEEGIKNSTGKNFEDGRIDEEVMEKVLHVGNFISRLLEAVNLYDTDLLCKVRNIKVADSRIENGIIDFVLYYEMKVPMLNKYLQLRQRARIKDWTGSDIVKEMEKVYITKNGAVYHKSKNCSHLIVNISKTFIDEVGDLRNSSGAKYYACEYCARGEVSPDTKLFVAEDGNRYHLSLQCRGIIRHIIEVDISQVSDLKPCSECGGGG